MDQQLETEVRALIQREVTAYEFRMRRIVMDELKNLFDEVGAGLRQHPGADFIEEAEAHIYRKGETLSKLGH